MLCHGQNTEETSSLACLLQRHSCSIRENGGQVTKMHIANCQGREQDVCVCVSLCARCSFILSNVSLLELHGT